MERIFRKFAKSNINKFIICLVFCMAVLTGMCPQTDTPILRTGQNGVSMICAPASAGDAKVATRETLGQGSNVLRSQFRLEEGSRRLNRYFQTVYLVLETVLPGFLLGLCRVLFEFGERKVIRKAFIIRFIHDLDGRKWVVS